MDLRAGYERRRTLFIHNHRVSRSYRSKVALAVWGGAVVLLAVAMGIRRLIDGSFDPVLTVLLGLGVVATVLSLTRPAPPPHAHGLAGVPDESCGSKPPNVGPWVIAARTVGAAAVLAFAANLPAGIVLAMLVVLAAIAGHVIAYRFLVWRRTKRIARALRAHGPRFAIAYAGFGGGPTHLSMWEGPLLSAGHPGVIFNFRDIYCAHLRENTDLSSPFVQLSSDMNRDLEHLVVPGLGAFFYVHNAMSNLRYMTVREVKHIWLGHGDSDKPASVFDRHAKYDLLVASGTAAIDRYTDAGVHIPREKFVVLGRPQVHEIESAKAPIASVDRPVVLYAPTWQGKNDAVDFSSLTVGAEIVRALVGRADIMFRPHPLSSRAAMFKPLVEEIDALLAADTADPSTPGKHVWGEQPNQTWSIFECMNRSDALVSDVSSVVSDWLQSGKPYAMVSTRWNEAAFREQFPVARAGYVLRGDLSNAATLFDDMLGGDSLKDERMALRTRVLGGFDGNESAEAFAAYFHEMFSRFDAST